MEKNKEKWENLHAESRYRPKYPSEVVVQFVFRNFVRNGKTKVLDLGCGAGRYVFFMGKENIVPYGIDFSGEGVEYTKKILCDNEMQVYADNIKKASLCDVPFQDNIFDGIICYGVLYYLCIADIKKAVEELKRMLSPGGKILLVVRSTEDYRCKASSCHATDEENTYIICEEDSEKCAHSENGMLMHFFSEKELRELFCDFQELKIDRITETHENGKFCDSNFILTAVKEKI